MKSSPDFESQLMELAIIHPYPLPEIRTIFKKCVKVYGEDAFDKCNQILTFARESNIGIDEAYKLQIAIDFKIR